MLDSSNTLVHRNSSNLVEKALQILKLILNKKFFDILNKYRHLESRFPCYFAEQILSSAADRTGAIATTWGSTMVDHYHF